MIRPCLNHLSFRLDRGARALGVVVEGPVPGTPFLGGPAMGGRPARTLAAGGYLEEEYWLSGTATRFDGPEPLPETGVVAVEPGAAAPYRTRLLVRRPAAPGRCNGAVLVEWLNVTTGTDIAPVYSHAHRHLLRAGFAWVGVSAQRGGIEGVPGSGAPLPPLKAADPARYGHLDLPGDAFAFDIFSQAGLVARHGAAPLGVPAGRLIAVGESQSAHYLITYLNAIDPLARVFDGALVMGRAASSAPLSGGIDLANRPAEFYTRGVRIREDVRIPVLNLDSETDVLPRGSRHARQGDGERLRIWEIAGAAHGDSYMLVASGADRPGIDPAQLARLMAPTRRVLGMTLAAPINAGPQQHYITEAAIHHLDRWVRDGVAPPRAPRLRLDEGGAGFALDPFGNVLGGIRSPWVDVPTAVLSGLAARPDGLAGLFGATRPFDAAQLRGLYPGGLSTYLARFAAALDRVIAEGFILAADRDEILALAAAAFPLAEATPAR